jgi:hypothetical protein
LETRADGLVPKLPTVSQPVTVSAAGALIDPGQAGYVSQIGSGVILVQT